MLTGRGVTLLVGAVLAWLAGRTFGIGELYAVAVAAVAIVGLGMLYVRQTTSSVSARRHTTVDRVIAGGTIEATLELRNDAPVPSPTLLVAELLPDALWVRGQPEPGTARFVVQGLRPGAVATAPYVAQARTRGRFSLGPVRVRVRDPFGTAERVRRYSATEQVVVYPRIEALQEQPVKGTHMGSGSSDSRRVSASGDEFYTMREYVRGDDLRMVHWPSTAHRRKLMVRQMEQAWQAHGTVFLDARTASHTAGPDGTLERAVSVAASLTYHLADRNYAVRLVTDSDTGRGGAEDWEHNLGRLAELEPSDNTGLGPSVAATRGGEGLLAAVLGVPPDGHELAHHPDLRALFGVRGFGQRLAFVVHEHRQAQRAEHAALLLVGAGWRAVPVAVDAPLATAWNQLMQAQRRSGSAPAPTGGG